MVVRAAVAAAVLSMGILVSAGARADEPDRCSLGNKFFVASVTAYNTTENMGYTTYRQFRGAELFVPAQPGLTPEWLQRVLSYEIATGACDFGARDAAVGVLSNGGGFSVRVSSNDERTAGQILRHAQQMVK